MRKSGTHACASISRTTAGDLIVRVSRTLSPMGSTYRIYRSDDNFVSQMSRLVPYLQADRYNVLIGGTDSEPSVVLTIGPLDAATDAEFRQRLVQYMDK
jgi:hypothetical protein